MEEWIRKATKTIEDDAKYAYGMCENSALKEKVELDFVIERFLSAFHKFAKGGDGK